jgi:hypothetical protein
MGIKSLSKSKTSWGRATLAKSKPLVNADCMRASMIRILYTDLLNKRCLGRRYCHSQDQSFLDHREERCGYDSARQIFSGSLIINWSLIDSQTRLAKTTLRRSFERSFDSLFFHLFFFVA